MQVLKEHGGDLAGMRQLDQPSLATEAAERIVAGIADGSLEPGRRIVESQLADALAISRIPIRDALRALEKQGIVVVVPRRGARVMNIDLGLLVQVQQVRHDLELRALADLIQESRKDPALIERGRELLGCMDTAVARDDRAGFNDLDVDFHRWICRSSGNHVVMTLWEALAHHMRILLGRMAETWRDLAVSQASHRRIVELVVAGDLDGLRSVMPGHLLDGVERVSYDAQRNRFVLHDATATKTGEIA
ncbi:MAG: GntR family transcriptional regulator [Proteobacteria bacterium]|nr:GntR family transcriptional regulator [Pseudomonadota bacterium]